ncbi:OLC1v1009073C1 [Oldenlandia corymbosa var. corymbosa]|uniref:OLC1v1009073C1 n=1 Tax=Oldenlandia corymbosa var. corymbosa TaxID=529605 RepID=A0AAV1DN75_OLDCO|nr:OLC1v1009073C1 [Oldenlandia corymbosa var. corymbosa]
MKPGQGSSSKKLLDFLNTKPPPNYVAGLGRGATGFTTRSDIGPARLPAVLDRPIGDNQKFDDFVGNDAGLLASAEYDVEDNEADAVYEAFPRKERNEASLIQEIEKHRVSNPTITEQSATSKRKLLEVTPEEWDNLPEASDHSMFRNKKNKKNKYESFVPVPDTLGESEAGEGARSRPWTRRARRSTGRRRMEMITSHPDIADNKKLSRLFHSVTNSNPKEPRGWISAARVEVAAGRLAEAQKLIKRGIEECPNSEDLWLEAVGLSPPGEAKSVIARGVKLNPYSVKLWMEAARLEHDIVDKGRVLRKGLERIPGSIRLWKAVVDLSDKEDAVLLLHRAVECCPLHVELWIALAGLETYENAKKILNMAREKLPKEPVIWISAAKLEESNGNDSMVGKVIEKGIRSLRREGVEIDREFWMKEAEAAERTNSVVTCQAIVHNVIGIGVEEEDRKRTWVADAEECEKRGSIETARVIYAHAISVFLTKKSVWLKAAQLEKCHGTRESLDALLRKAVTYMPKVEVFWLMGAKEKWLAGDVPAVRSILQEAFAAIPNSEEILLAAFKVEFESHERERARALLAKVRVREGTERVWMKSAIVERELGNTTEERRLLDEGVKRFPSFFKLWLMLGQLEERLGHLKQAKKTYETGLKHCTKSVPLWLSLASLEEKTDDVSKVRAVLTMARMKNPRNPQLWLAAIRVESRNGNKKEADKLMAKALQECPTSGILLATEIEMVPQPQRKLRCFDALKNCEKDPYVNAAAAKLYVHHGKVEKARGCFDKAVELAPDNGDIWALFYEFEIQHGNEQTQKDVVKRCVASEPKYGEMWQPIAKAVENSHQKTESILKKVMVSIGKGKRIN